MDRAEALYNNSDKNFTLAVIDDADWNRDFSPWKAAKVFKDSEDFSGGAAVYLNRLITEIIPEAEAKQGIRPLQRGILGYSLAGLFALYAFINTDFFCFAGSVSGSLWFDGWLDYIKEKAPALDGRGRVYLSVGDNESHARNQRMKCVEDNTKLTEELLKKAGCEVMFELNRGGHFTDTEVRVLKCIKWLKGGN
jgi:predicted alpha/beta superfamily hydrolase